MQLYHDSPTRTNYRRCKKTIRNFLIARAATVQELELNTNRSIYYVRALMALS